MLTMIGLGSIVNDAAIVAGGCVGLVAGLEKLYDEPVRSRSSSPKLAVCNNALRTAMQTGAPSELRADPVRWGHTVESAVGAQIMASVRRSGIDLLYWNVGCKEVDYVLRSGFALVAAREYRIRHGCHSKLPQYREFVIYCSA